MIIHMYPPAVYEYEGWMFEVHKMTGPWPLLKHGYRNPSKQLYRPQGSARYIAPKRFWDAYERFDALPKEEQEKFCVEQGGRVRF